MRRIWRTLRYFSPEEFHYPNKLNPDMLRLLDSMRASIDGQGIVTINADFDFAGHAPNSWHYKGRAVDLVIRNSETKEPLNIVTQLLIALRFNWKGIGVYPYWRSPGLHLDNRPLSSTDRRAMWWQDESGKYRAIEDFYKLYIPTYGQNLSKEGSDA